MAAETHRLDDWDDLRFFVAVAREGGLSAASRSLAVNQSTVFRRIAQLEQRLGARLFERQPRGYRLTAVGERMLPLALRVEDDVLALLRGVHGADSSLGGAVRITTVPEVLECVAPHMGRFRQRFPGIRLEVDTEQRLLSLTRREADVAIRPGRAPDEPQIVGRKLVPLASAAYASPGYLADRCAPRSLQELAEHPLISFPRGRPGGPPLHPELQDMEPVFSATSMTAQASAARAGLGVALLPTFIGDRDANLLKLFTPPRRLELHLWLLIHGDLRQTARVRAFLDFMTEAIRQDRALYDGSGAAAH